MESQKKENTLMDKMLESKVDVDSKSKSCADLPELLEVLSGQVGDMDINQDAAIPVVNKEVETKDLVIKSNEDVVNTSFPFDFSGLNHVALICDNLEKTLEFYCGILGMRTCPERPELPYRGAWLFLGGEGLHIMEVPNPDPIHGRPPHGGYDRHACINCNNMENLMKTLDKAEIPYQVSMIPSVFCRDPDGNGLEFIQYG